jgi:hypothetical protein
VNKLVGGQWGDSRWVGKVSKAKKKKRKLGGGRGENEVPGKKLRSGLRKGKEKRSTWDGKG